MAMKRGSTRDEVYHRLTLNPLHGDIGKQADPQGLTEFLHLIGTNLQSAGDRCVGRGGLLTKSFILQATRLAYICMQRHGVIYRNQSSVEGAEDRDVRSAINGEREHQDKINDERFDGATRSLADFVMIMRVYLRKAEEGWVSNAGDKVALDGVRIIAALGVWAMEQFGIQGV